MVLFQTLSYLVGYELHGSANHFLVKPVKQPSIGYARCGRRRWEAAAHVKKTKETEVTQTRLAPARSGTAKTAVLYTLTSESAQRSYDHAITEFVDWYCSEPRLR